MRILLVSHGAGPYGAERVLLAAASGLAGRGHEVVVDLPHEGPALQAALRAGGYEVHVSGRRPLPPRRRDIPRFLLAAPAAAASIRRLARRVEPDVVWVSSMYNPWAAIGARMARRPVIWHLHERIPPFPVGAALAALIAATAKRAVAVSEFVGGGFGRYPLLARRMRVVHNPLLDPPPRPVGEAAEPFTVGCVGQIERRKRPGDVLRALAALPGTRAVFVGGGKAWREVEDMARELNVSGRVAFRGYRADIAAEAARFGCLAIPSLDEGFGLVAVEGMALGVPIVAARSGALPEILGDAALYFDPGDPADLASQVDRLRADPALRRRLVDRGLQRVEAFDRERWLDALEDTLADALSDGAAR